MVAIVAFLIYATAKSGKVPEGAIGQADAMTNIQVNGDFIFDASHRFCICHNSDYQSCPQQ